MDSATETFAGPLIDRATNLIVDYAISGIKYITQYRKQIKEVKRLMHQLSKRKDELEKEVQKREVQYGQKMTSEAEAWLYNVNELIINDENLKQIREMPDETIHRNPCERCKWGKIASEGCTNIQTLLLKAPSNEKLTKDVSGEDVKKIILEKVASPWKSRDELMEDLIDKLLDHEVNLVGLYGPQGVGKTVLVRDINRDEKVKKAFNRIVIVKVGSNPDLREIQDKIAKGLKISLKDDDTIDIRTYQLNMEISSRREKVLIILDDVCEYLNLRILGTYNDLCNHLVVSDSANVCEIMRVNRENTLEMKLMSEQEAESFFWKKVYDLKRRNTNMADQVTTYAYISLAKKLINSYCNCSTNAIMSLAKLLGNKELTAWKELDEELQKKQDSLPLDKVIVKKSTEIQSQNIKFPPAKEFFALACVLSKESSISILELMRCAIGLELIKDVDKLSDAMSEAQNWVQELEYVSWLEEDDDDTKWSGGLGYVSISNHDAYNNVIEEREEKGWEKYMLKSISKWRLNDDIQPFIENTTIISLASGHNHTYIGKVKFNNLKILILDCSQPKNDFRENFFEGMSTLKVLILKGMKFDLHPPTSLENLINLTTLHLESCEYLGDIAWIGKLERLVCLSLRESRLKEIPADKMRKLQKLQVLDLTKCEIEEGGIPANVLSELNLLEGFYAYDIRCEEDWANCSKDVTNHSKNDSDVHINKVKGSEQFENTSVEISRVNLGSTECSIEELNKLERLNVLEIKVRRFDQLPTIDDFVTNLDHFYIFVGQDAQPPVIKSAKGFSRVLRFGYTGAFKEEPQPIHKLIGLLSKTEFLSLENMEQQASFVPEYSKKQTITSKKNYFDDFQKLIKLEISECHQMESFTNIATKAPVLTDLKVEKCGKMKYIFKEQDKDYEFPHLSTIVLSEMDKLSTITSTETTIHHIPPFFNKKMTFPSLETLHLHNCGQIESLWPNNNFETKYLNTWKNLKELKINKCHKLKNLGSIAIAAALEQLTKLYIEKCQTITEVITEVISDANAFDHNDKPLKKIFPKLEYVKLDNCRNLEKFILTKKSDKDLELPSLVEVHIRDCSEMDTFSTGSIRIPKLKWLTVEPCCHELSDTTGGINNFIKDVKQRYDNQRIRNIDESSKKDNAETQKTYWLNCFKSTKDKAKKEKSRNKLMMAQSNKPETQIVTVTSETPQGI